MKVAYIERIGSPEIIRYADLPGPDIRAGQMLVKVSAVTVNPVGTYIRSGSYPMPLCR
jgi:NADPH2:quinone reductase